MFIMSMTAYFKSLDNRLTGAMFARPVIAPWPFTREEVRMKSVKPPRTRNGALGFFRGYRE